ncbi:MAG: FtsX-like permease family protein [Planctomycetaceae bacterium]|nr:FtsX-like permease family protein [Planctomycetaceae bacterium]
MYKLLLCWRYLLTRFIALASVISVMLGVATLITVNSVMNGFRHELETRLHGVHSDVILQSGGIDGFKDPEEHIAIINHVAGDMIEGMTPTVVVPALLTFKIGDEYQPRKVDVVGIDIKTIKNVGDITKFLQHPENRKVPGFALRDGGYDSKNHIDPKDSAFRPDMKIAGWGIRRLASRYKNMQNSDLGQLVDQSSHSGQSPSGQTSAQESGELIDPLQSLSNATPASRQVKPFDPATDQQTGLFLGIGISTMSRGMELNPETGKEELIERMKIIPGDDVILSFPKMTRPPTFADATFTVTDIYECRMSDFDSNFVFVPIEKIQELRGMIDPQSGKRFATQILIKAKPGVDLEKLRDTIRGEFSPYLYSVMTWKDQESTLIDAVTMETQLLNVLLFLIIAVAGFGILAIFYMIVLEKFRDIGIMKALGASGFGIMQIFLAYSLTLGLVGAALGTIIGLQIVWNINTIAHWLSFILGHEVFDPSIYMFSQIPTLLEPAMVVKVVAGSLLIAVISGVLPAIRAARLHPVRALRFE